MGGIVSQLIVFGALAFALRQFCLHFPVRAAFLLGEHKPEVFACVACYAVSFLWFGRGFWGPRLRWFASGLAGIILVLCVGSGLAKLSRATGSSSGEGFAVLFVVATVCSAGFWTLTARSIIGGLAFCVASQILSAMLVMFAIQQVVGHGSGEGFLGVVAVCIAGLLYAAIFLVLGWRKFERLELRDAGYTEGVSATAARHWNWQPNWLVCRPKGKLLNLLRKESRLQKPVLLVAATFLVCWLGALGLCSGWPERHYTILLEILLAFYVPLTLMLAGSVSLGEEKALGVTGLQLALPIPVQRLWLVKLLFSNVAGLTFGFVLPCCLALLAASTDPMGRRDGAIFGSDWLVVLPLAWVTILVSFWASTVASSTVRAVLVTIAAIALGWGCAALGTWSAAAFSDGGGGLQQGLLVLVMTNFQLSPITIVDLVPAATWAAGFATAVLLIGFLLVRSLAHFRRGQGGRTNLLGQGFVLGLLILSYKFWVSDFASSAHRLYQSKPIMELENAFQALASQAPAPAEKAAQVVTMAQLERAAPLSSETKTWLRNAVISYRRGGGEAEALHIDPMLGYTGTVLAFGPNGESHHVGRLYQLSIRFPGGGTYNFGWLTPVRGK